MPPAPGSNRSLDDYHRKTVVVIHLSLGLRPERLILLTRGVKAPSYGQAQDDA